MANILTPVNSFSRKCQKEHLKIDELVIHMETLIATLESLKTTHGECETLFMENFSPQYDQDSGKLVLAGFDYTSSQDNIERIELVIPKSRFGILPDDDVKASKLKYINCIITELDRRTQGFRELLKCFDITHKKTSPTDDKAKLVKLKIFLPIIDVSETQSQYITMSQFRIILNTVQF